MHGPKVLSAKGSSPLSGSEYSALGFTLGGLYVSHAERREIVLLSWFVFASNRLTSLLDFSTWEAAGRFQATAVLTTNANQCNMLYGSKSLRLQRVVTRRNGTDFTLWSKESHQSTYRLYRSIIHSSALFVNAVKESLSSRVSALKYRGAHPSHWPSFIVWKKKKWIWS